MKVEKTSLDMLYSTTSVKGEYDDQGHHPLGYLGGSHDLVSYSDAQFSGLPIRLKSSKHPNLIFSTTGNMICYDCCVIQVMSLMLL